MVSFGWTGGRVSLGLTVEGDSQLHVPMELWFSDEMESSSFTSSVVRTRRRRSRRFFSVFQPGEAVAIPRRERLAGASV